MSDRSEISSLSMSSMEIADVSGKQHHHVLRDIDKMLEELHPNLDSPIKSTTYKDSNGVDRRMYRLDKELTLTLTSGYSVRQRHKIIHRWLELEAKEAKQQPPPMTQIEILAAIAQEMAKLERKQLAIEAAQEQQEQFNEEVEEKLGKIEVSTRNGVPDGFLSKKMARRKYNLGFSKDIFDTIMTVMKVTQQTYLHNENGHTTFTIAWKEDEIPNSVLAFRASITQETKTLCSSSLLHGQRFRYSLDKPTLQ